MKRLLIIFIFLFSINMLNIASFAETKTVMAVGALDVPNIFALESYYAEGDPNVLYTTNVPFTQMDPSRTWVESDGRELDSTKSDIGLLCRTNLGEIWYLKIQGNPSPLITIGNLKYGLWQPWNRTLNQPSDGEIIGGAGWHPLPSGSPTTVYNGGPLDYDNLTQGTLCTFSFAINPSGLDPTQIYQCTIQFTLTSLP